MPYLQLLFLVIFTVSIFSFFSLAPWLPTRKFDLERIQKIVQLKKWETFLEIWCGTARVSLFLAKNNPESTIVWVELSPLLYLISKLKVAFSRQKNIQIIYGNALKLDLEKYDILYVFGLPETISEKLFPKIKDIKNKNFRLISYAFQMKQDVFEEVKNKPEGRYSIYEYKVKS